MAARDRHNKNCRYDKEVPCVIKRQRRSERQKARISEPHARMTPGALPAGPSCRPSACPISCVRIVSYDVRPVTPKGCAGCPAHPAYHCRGAYGTQELCMNILTSVPRTWHGPPPVLPPARAASSMPHVLFLFTFTTVMVFGDSDVAVVSPTYCIS